MLLVELQNYLAISMHMYLIFYPFHFGYQYCIVMHAPYSSVYQSDIFWLHEKSDLQKYVMKEFISYIYCIRGEGRILGGW
jgi:hypothetical protein